MVGERSSLTGVYVRQLQRTDSHPNQPPHRLADGVEHPAYLPLPALGQHDAIPAQLRVRRRQQIEQLSNLGGRGVLQHVDSSQALLELDAVAQRQLLLPGDRSVQADHVLALDAVAGVQQQVRPGTVVGEEQQPLRLFVQAADRIEARLPAGVRRQQLHDRSVGVAVPHGRDDAGRLVEHPVRTLALDRRERLAVDQHALHLGIDLLTQDSPAARPP